MATSKGVCKLTLKRTTLTGKDEVVEAELWRTSKFLITDFVVFCACVYLAWNGTRYTILRRQPTDYANEYWLELEHRLSNVIMVNE